MSRTRKPWQILGVVAFLVVFVWLALVGSRESVADEWVHAIGNAGWPAFFAAMTLLPLIGVPVTPFYLIAGAVFDEWLSLTATALSLLLNLVLAYFLAARWMRHALQTLLARHGDGVVMPAFSSRRHTWLYILAVRVTPGPPLSVKNYLAGLAGVPIGPYLIISWPIAMGYAAGLIVLGDSLTEQHWVGVVAGIVVLGVFLTAMFILRSWLRGRGARLRRATDPEPPR